MAARAAIGLDSKTLPQLRKKEQSLPQIVDHTRPPREELEHYAAQVKAALTSA
jgi:hypothetical protein